MKQCPYCYQWFQSLGLASHRAACWRKWKEKQRKGKGRPPVSSRPMRSDAPSQSRF
jgi:hypothetical protein